MIKQRNVMNFAIDHVFYSFLLLNFSVLQRSDDFVISQRNLITVANTIVMHLSIIYSINFESWKSTNVFKIVLTSHI